MQLRLALILASAALLHARGTLLGYAFAASVMADFSKVTDLLKDPVFLFGFLAFVGMLMIAGNVLQIAFSLVAPAMLTLLLAWCLLTALKPRMPLGQLGRPGVLVAIFAALSAVGLLALGVEDGGHERNVSGEVAFSILSSLGTGYLLSKQIYRLTIRPGGPGAA